METLPLFQVDAFTDTAFKGNSAAVVLLPEEDVPSDAALQSIAMENNLSETAYIRPIPPSSDVTTGDNFDLRWFTPTTEVKLCGHATLASAAALWKCLGNTAPRLRFQTLSGELSVVQGPSGRISMDFPLNRAVADVPLGTAAGSRLVRAVAGTIPVREVLHNPDINNLLVVLEGGREELLSIRPRPGELLDAHPEKLLVIVTAKGEGEHDFFYRFFAPWAGIDEDPVTGSACTVAAPYWAARLGKTELRARQLSQRTGELYVGVREDAGRVIVAGDAVVVISGQLHLQ